MYLQESIQPIVYRFKYCNSREHGNTNGPGNSDEPSEKTLKDADLDHKNRTQVKSFLEPDENTFANIRKKLSTLSLTTEYKKESFAPSPMFNERKYARRRISSLGPRDTISKKVKERRRKGLSSRESFYSDDHEYRFLHPSEFDPFRNTNETSKLTEGIITPRHHPELFTQQIKDLEKSKPTRVTSPKSSRSIDSSGKVHLGLIETLDLTEQLDDVEKIKQRYSSDYFTKSLNMYKARGHDRCFNRSGMTEHIPRGTRLFSPDSMRPGSKLSYESAQTMSSISTPYSSRSTNVRLTPMVLPHHYLQDGNPLHVQGFQQAPLKLEESENNPPEKKEPKKVRRKSVGFNMVQTEVHGNDGASSNASSPREGANRELKSILKKKPALSKTKWVEIQEQEGDEFHANPNYYWKFHLPRLQSPAPAAKVRQATQFRKKMYHYGQGISDEFEEVINRYGNCRQNSMVRDPSIIREPSSHVT